MGGSDDSLNATIAHVVLALSAANSLKKINNRMYQYTGTHANLFIHSVVGMANFHSNAVGQDFSKIYEVTLNASKYLPLAFINADAYKHQNKNLAYAHIASGVIPMAMAICEPCGMIKQIGNMCIILNVISLLCFSFENDREYGYYTGGVALLTYFTSIYDSPKFLYPLGLALMDFLSIKVLSR